MHLLVGYHVLPEVGFFVSQAIAGGEPVSCLSDDAIVVGKGFSFPRNDSRGPSLTVRNVERIPNRIEAGHDRIDFVEWPEEEKLVEEGGMAYFPDRRIDSSFERNIELFFLEIVEEIHHLTMRLIDGLEDLLLEAHLDRSTFAPRGRVRQATKPFP